MRGNTNIRIVVSISFFTAFLCMRLEVLEVDCFTVFGPLRRARNFLLRLLTFFRFWGIIKFKLVEIGKGENIT